MDFNQTETWKFFDQNPLTHSAAHYLMTVHELHEDQGYARLTDIARKLNISAGSCSISLKALKKKGLIEEDGNKFLNLTKNGQMLVELVERNDELLGFFFTKVLGVDKWQAEIDACKMEHLLSIETSLKLASFVDLIQKKGETSQKFLAELRAIQKEKGK